MKCYHCGEKITDMDALGAEVSKGKWRDVCRECYDEIVHTCQLCGDNDVMPSDVSEFILVKMELAGSRTPPGIYRILSRPFLLIPLVGGGSLMERDVLFIDRLPKPDCDYEISGHICRKCSAPYERIDREVYAVRMDMRRQMLEYRGCKGWQDKWRALLQLSPGGWEIQRNHTRRVIMANPDMLRDLECENDQWSTFASLKRLYDLPDLPTYHEWLFLEHKGVRVFECYLTDSAWLTLRPNPKYRANRNTQDGFTFCAQSLPTWHYEGPHQYEHPKEDRLAVIQAIDAGIITQDKIKHRKAKCREHRRGVDLEIREGLRTT